MVHSSLSYAKMHVVKIWVHDEVYCGNYPRLLIPIPSVASIVVFLIGNKCARRSTLALMIFEPV